MPMHTKTGPGYLWSVAQGPFTDDEWQRYIEGCRSLIDGPGGVAITVSEDAAPNAAQRKLLVDVLSNPRAGEVIEAHCFVSSSALARGVLTAVNWLTKKPYPERTFSSLRSGLVWVAEVVPTLYVGALEGEMREMFPTLRL